MKWISVKDSLPNKNSRYLVNIHQEDEDRGESRDFVVEAWYHVIPLISIPKCTGWVLLNEFYDLTEQLREDISHWMPFPISPYEEEKNEIC